MNRIVLGGRDGSKRRFMRLASTMALVLAATAATGCASGGAAAERLG